MTHHKSGRLRLVPETLVRIYRTMQENPLKIFTRKSLGLNSWKETPYLNTLVKLGLIEEVQYYAQYVKRDGKLGRRVTSTTGWRLKQ